MAFKCTWLFNGDSDTSVNARPFGFSESWYYTGSTGAAVLAMDEVSAERRKILARGCSIVGYRISSINGSSVVIRNRFGAPVENDHPNLPVDSALCQVGIDGQGRAKRFFLHNLPDDWIVAGRIVHARRNEIKKVVEKYVSQNFKVRYTNLAAATAQVLSISEAGLVTTLAAHGFSAGNLVTLLRCRDVNNQSRRGTYAVGSVPTPTTFTLVHWIGREVARSGRFRVNTYAEAAAISLGDEGVVAGSSRKVGRPFFLVRGRAPSRR